MFFRFFVIVHNGFWCDFKIRNNKLCSITKGKKLRHFAVLKFTSSVVLNGLTKFLYDSNIFIYN